MGFVFVCFKEVAGVCVCMNVCICVYVFSYMEATLLNVKVLQSKCLYAAHYPPLVANQRNPNSSYITVRRRIIVGLKLR